MQIGQKVSFVRNTMEHEIVEGNGRVKALTLDPENRPVVHVLDDVLGDDGGEQVFTIHVASIDPDKVFVEKFTDLVNRVKRYVDDVNAEIKQKTDEANVKIVELNNALFGEPFVFDVDED